MRRRIIFPSLLFGAALGAVVLNTGAPPRPAEGSCRRIVSMVPSLTEVVYAVGRGERVVGVTDFCAYPREVLTVPRLGGYFDPNYEAILALAPDIVLTMPEQAELRRGLAVLGIRAAEVNQRDIAGILNSITIVGRLCDAAAEAAALRADLEARLRAVTAKTQGLGRPRVLVCVGRPVGSGRLEEIYVAGTRTFYDEVLTRAGGVNACRATTADYPTLSAEGVIGLDPDVIIDLIPDGEKRGVRGQDAVIEWNVLASLAAVKHGRVHALTDDFVTIPGPRFILALERVARLLHPEAPWENP
jgi:iron complex transport system substrate-binding protein